MKPVLCCFTPLIPFTSRAERGWTKARNWQGPSHLSHHVLLPRDHVSSNLELEIEPGLDPGRHSQEGPGCPTQQLPGFVGSNLWAHSLVAEGPGHRTWLGFSHRPWWEGGLARAQSTCWPLGFQIDSGPGCVVPAACPPVCLGKWN